MRVEWPTAQSRLKAIAKAASDKKADDILVFDVSKISNIADYFFICSGQNVRQTQTIADEIEKQLAEMKAKPMHSEGRSGGRWILLDCDDIIVHIFIPQTRDFFDLERLWGDAPIMDISSLIKAL